MKTNWRRWEVWGCCFNEFVAQRRKFLRTCTLFHIIRNFRPGQQAAGRIPHHHHIKRQRTGRTEERSRSCAYLDWRLANIACWEPKYTEHYIFLDEIEVRISSLSWTPWLLLLRIETVERLSAELKSQVSIYATQIDQLVGISLS